MKVTDLEPEQLETAANMLRAIAHPIRISIVGLLEDGVELTVTEIHSMLNIEQSTASHHLGILKDKGVLNSCRRGKNAVYSLRYTDLSNIVHCISNCACK